MTIDNRTELNDCESASGWTGDGATPAPVTLTGQFYEGAASIGSQHSDVDEHMSTTEESVGTTTFSLDWSDTTAYLMLKDNLVDTKTNGGVQFVIGDGTDKIGFTVGGNDSSGLPLVPFFNTYKLDVSNRGGSPGNTVAYTGSETSLTVTTITEVGIGTLHLAKAQGNVQNLFVDYISYIANGLPALTIDGGTVGTPETMTDIQADDVSGGIGLIANPFGSLFLFFGPTEWGDSGSPAVESYFTGTDEQWYWLGDTAGPGNFDFALVGNVGVTNSFVLSSVVIVDIDVRAAFDLAPANHDIMQLTSVTFTDLGPITFPTVDAGNKFADNCIFNNCDQVVPSTIDMDSPSFNGTTDANGAMLMDGSTVSNIIAASFTSDGTGHGIHITATGTYDFDNWTFDGYGADDTTDAAIFNDTEGLVTINILNSGDTPSVRNATGSPAATTVINNAVTVRLEGVTEGAAIKFIADETSGTITIGDVILEALADSTGAAETSFNFEAAFTNSPAGLDVIARARASGLPNAAIQDDNDVFTDQTEAANTFTGSPIPLMNLLPAVPVAGEDRYLFGHSEFFTQLKLNINTAGTGGFTITWQYWNGAWTNLSGVVDGTSSFSIAGTNIVSWDDPGDAVKMTVNGQGPFFYVRAAYTAGTVTIVPDAFKCTLDVTKYIPFVQENTITSTGLTVTASWVEDTIAGF